MSDVTREVYEDCDLHRALMNTGYKVYRKKCYEGGRLIRTVDFYVPEDYREWEPPEWMIDRSGDCCYRMGRGGNFYPVEFLEMYPYTYGKW